MYATPRARPPPMKQFGHPCDTAVDAPGLSAAAVHVDVARFGPDEWNAFTTWLVPPCESAAELSVKSHHTPAFAANTRCDRAEWPVASANAPAICAPTRAGGDIAAETVNATLLLDTPFTMTTTGPVVAVEGTGTVMLVSLQLDGDAARPLKVTVLVPWALPEFGVSVVTVGALTVKVTPLLAAPSTVTTTGPLAAPAGTFAVMVVSVQFVVLAIVPLNWTLLVPCVARKLSPEIVTDVPAMPDAGDSALIVGAGAIVIDSCR